MKSLDRPSLFLLQDSVADITKYDVFFNIPCKTMISFDTIYVYGSIAGVYYIIYFPSYHLWNMDSCLWLMEVSIDAVDIPDKKYIKWWTDSA